MSTGTEKGALFVCLGNICRSPIAEAVFLQALEARGLRHAWKVDSAAIGPWHIGKTPDHRATATLKTHNVPYNNRARQVQKDDFEAFDYIFGMDDENMSDLEDRAPAGSLAKLLLLGDFDPEGQRIIRDPYYDKGAQGFETCYQQCVRCCNAFLDSI